MYAKLRARSKFYHQAATRKNAYGASPNLLRRPQITKKGLLFGVYTDQTVDLREKENLEFLEAVRHPKERDFYQDHTFHNQWVTRELEAHQKRSIAARYRFMQPGYQINPWLWYPGDIVEVVSGEATGQRGAIIGVVAYKNEIVVQNINVQDISIPASEDRPEQVIQREHPISVTVVKHVDPTTNKTCDLKIVTVRNKENNNALEEKRISLSSGVLLPIPPTDESVQVGDPLRDTPLQDAEESTYFPEKELPVLVQRKLHAMESHFVKQLASVYEFHAPLEARNFQDWKKFQFDVVKRAEEMAAKYVATASLGAAFEGFDLNDDDGAGDAALAAAATQHQQQRAGGEQVSSWYGAAVSPFVEALVEEEGERARQSAAEAAGKQRVAASNADGDDNEDEEQEEEDEEGEEEEEEEQQE